MDLLNALKNAPYIFYDEEIISPEKINRDREEQKITDLIFVTPDGNKHHVHKAIVATRCSYFESLFNSGLLESTQAEIQLDHNISEEILTYIYTGRVEITAENAFMINESAHFFLLSKLKKASDKVLVKYVNIENILTLWNWAGISLNNELKIKCFDFIMKDTEIFLEKYVLSLNYDEITEIVSNTDFTGENLYLILVKWIKDDFENRQNYIGYLLKHINLADLSDDFKIRVIQTDEVLLNSMQFLRFMTKKALKTNTIYGTEIESITTNSDDLVFAILKERIAVLKLKKSRPRLVPIIRHDFNTSFQPINYKEDKILFCGVDNENKKCKTYSYRRKDCDDISPMLEGREQFGITKLHDKIYVCGGSQNNGSVEIYDINTDKWNYGKSMSSHLACFKIVNCNQSIYTLGGRDLFTNHGTEIIQRYDSRENIWEIVCSNAIPMPCITEAFAVKENAVRCIYDDTSVLSVCGFDVRNNNMFKVPSKIPSLLYSSVCQSKDNVYILGFNMGQGYEKTFGKLDNLSTSYPVEFTEISGIDLSAFNGGFVKFVNVGSDQYNYLAYIELYT